MRAFEELDELGMARMAARYSLVGIRADWSKFPTGALLLALEMLPYEAPWVETSMNRLAADEGLPLFTVEVARGIWTLREVLEGRGDAKGARRRIVNSHPTRREAGAAQEVEGRRPPPAP